MRLRAPARLWARRQADSVGRGVGASPIADDDLALITGGDYFVAGGGTCVVNDSTGEVGCFGDANITTSDGRE